MHPKLVVTPILVQEIKKKIEEGNGYRKVSLHLEKIGFRVSHETVRKISKENGFKSKKRQTFDGWDPKILWLREWLEETTHGKNFMEFIRENPKPIASYDD